MKKDKTTDEIQQYFKELVDGTIPNSKIQLAHIYGRAKQYEKDQAKTKYIDDAFANKLCFPYTLNDKWYISERLAIAKLYVTGKRIPMYTPFVNRTNTHTLYYTLIDALISGICMAFDCKEAAPFMLRALGLEMMTEPEYDRSLGISINDCKFFVPSYHDWNAILTKVGKSFTYLHWVDDMPFWCRDIDEGSERQVCRTNDNCIWMPSDTYNPPIGFRPAFFPLNEAMAETGSRLMRFALYLNGVEQLSPITPTCDGYIPLFKEGQRIEFKEATAPETTITWLWNGRCFIADRTLLQRVSYDDLRQQGF